MKNPKRKIIAQFRDYGMFEVVKKIEDSTFNFEDDISNAVSYLGNDVSGRKINDLIVGFSIYPDIDPDKFIYPVKKEEHFWILAKDCTAIGIGIKNSNLFSVIVYDPIYTFYTTKYYIYITQKNEIEKMLNNILTKTDVPLVIYNKGSFDSLSIDPVILKLIDVRCQREDFRLFKPSLDERTILKMKENRANLKYSMETVWIPRKEKGIINGCAIFHSGSCIFCFSVDNITTNGSTIIHGDSRIAIIYQVCKKCIDNRQEQSIYEKFINFLSKYPGDFDVHNFTYLSQNDYFNSILSKLNNEGLRFNHQIKKNGQELHLEFENNCLLIISYNNMLDYAYVFLKDNKEVLKWDSRDDHGLAAGLDHFHFDPKDYNKNVESSYLFGNFLIDFEIIFDKIKKFIKAP